MSYLKLRNLSVNNGGRTVNVGSDESLSNILNGDELELKGELAVLVESASDSSRTITLQQPWDEPNKSNVKGVIRATATNLRHATEKVMAVQSLSTQSLENINALTQTVTSVTIDIPGVGPTQIDSIPKILQDATVAGTTLMQNAQTAITAMGNAPALAQQVADDRQQVQGYKTTTLQALGTVESHLSTIMSAKSAAEQVLEAVRQVFDDFDDIYLGAHAVSPTTDNDGDPLRAGQVYWHTTDGVTGVLRFYNGVQWESPQQSATQAAGQAQSYKNQSASILNQVNEIKAECERLRNEQTQIAGGDAPNALKFNDKTEAQWRQEIVKYNGHSLTPVFHLLARNGELELKGVGDAELESPADFVIDQHNRLIKLDEKKPKVGKHGLQLHQLKSTYVLHNDAKEKWVYAGTSASFDGTRSPTGNQAVKVTVNSSKSSHRVEVPLSQTIGGSSLDRYVIKAVLVKAGDGGGASDRILIDSSGYSSWHINSRGGLKLNLITGQYEDHAASDFRIKDQSFNTIPLDNGWFLIWMRLERAPSGPSTSKTNLYMWDDGASTTFTGNGTDHIYIGDVMVMPQNDFIGFVTKLRNQDHFNIPDENLPAPPFVVYMRFRSRNGDNTMPRFITREDYKYNVAMRKANDVTPNRLSAHYSGKWSHDVPVDYSNEIIMVHRVGIDEHQLIVNGVPSEPVPYSYTPMELGNKIIFFNDEVDEHGYRRASGEIAECMFATGEISEEQAIALSMGASNVY